MLIFLNSWSIFTIFTAFSGEKYNKMETMQGQTAIHLDHPVEAIYTKLLEADLCGTNMFIVVPVKHIIVLLNHESG